MGTKTKTKKKRNDDMEQSPNEWVRSWTTSCSQIVCCGQKVVFVWRRYVIAVVVAATSFED
jgi:hypothetical protein